MKPMFSEGLSFFVFFFCNDGAMNFHRHVVDLSVSLTMSRPAETTQKLNMLRRDFSLLVLQISNGFDLKSLSFQVLFILILAVYENFVQLTLSESFCSTGFFLKGPK